MSSFWLRLLLGSSVAPAGQEDSNTPALRRRVQLAVLGLIASSSAATAGAMLLYHRRVRRRLRSELDDVVRSQVGPAAPRPQGSLGSASPPKYLSAIPDAAPPYSPGLAQAGRASGWDEDLLREQLARNYAFLGDDGMDKLRGSYVVVVGAGGVGSWAALMLLRSGVGRIRLIDFDQVSLSSLNRHACAVLADVGRPKVQCCAEYFSRVAPWAKTEALVEVYRPEEAVRLLLSPLPADEGTPGTPPAGEDRPDFVLDAIDNIETKVALLEFCYRNKVPVFASMGAGGKADPSRIQISDISDTSEDPLAASVRRRLRAKGIPELPPKQHLPSAVKRSKQRRMEKEARSSSTSKAATSHGGHGGDLLTEVPPDSEPVPQDQDQDRNQSQKPLTSVNSSGQTRIVAPPESTEPEPGFMLPVVYSTEKASISLLPLPEDEFAAGNAHELSPLEQFRVRILPVLGPLPAMFGLAAATYIMCSLAGHPMEPLAHKRRRKMYDKFHMDLLLSEKKTGGGKSIPFSVSDVQEMFDELFSGRSVVPPFTQLSQGLLLRWDSTLPLSWRNVALFTREQGKVHQTEVLDKGRSPVEVWGDATNKRVLQCLERERVLRLAKEL